MRGRRIFDHVDPYLAPPEHDPPEPPEDTGWQDPSMDIENVNAAYRIEYELASVYRTALEAIAGVSHEPESRALAVQALRFDPLDQEQSA